MTIDEAITHCEEIANSKCNNCGAEHKQLAEWLKDYKRLLEQKTGRWINGSPICPCCGEDKFKDLDADIWADWQPKYCPNCGAKMEV